MKVTILGCGSSSGVPVIGCDCAVCRSNDPKNKRTRVSVLVEKAGKKLLIDTSPDLRQQFLSNHIKIVDGVLYTHAHADHLHGIDDIRSVNYYSQKPLDCYMNNKTYDSIKSRFPYVFNLQSIDPAAGWYKPYLKPEIFEYNKPFEAHSMKVHAFEQAHGKGFSAGLRIDDFAYSTDTNGLSDQAFEALKGTKLWVVDCLRYTPAPTHANLELTLSWIKRVKPELAVLTHMAHEFDYETLKKELPAGVVPGYDGMTLEV